MPFGLFDYNDMTQPMGVMNYIPLVGDPASQNQLLSNATRVATTPISNNAPQADTDYTPANYSPQKRKEIGYLEDIVPRNPHRGLTVEDEAVRLRAASTASFGSEANFNWNPDGKLGFVNQGIGGGGNPNGGGGVVMEGSAFNYAGTGNQYTRAFPEGSVPVETPEISRYTMRFPENAPSPTPPSGGGSGGGCPSGYSPTPSVPSQNMPDRGNGMPAPDPRFYNANNFY